MRKKYSIYGYKLCYRSKSLLEKKYVESRRSCRCTRTSKCRRMRESRASTVGGLPKKKKKKKRASINSAFRVGFVWPFGAANSPHPFSAVGCRAARRYWSARLRACAVIGVTICFSLTQHEHSFQRPLFSVLALN